MSRKLVESIISNNMLEANDMVEAKLAEIREKKMYEMKRMFASKMDEGMGMKVGGDPEELRAKGYKKAAPELERRAKEAKAAYKQAKKEYKKATGKSKPDEDPYEGKGNAPWTMAARGFHNVKKKVSAIANKEPAAPGSKTLAVAKGVGSAIKHVGTELGKIGFSNLE